MKTFITIAVFAVAPTLIALHLIYTSMLPHCGILEVSKCIAIKEVESTLIEGKIKSMFGLKIKHIEVFNGGATLLVDVTVNLEYSDKHKDLISSKMLLLSKKWGCDGRIVVGGDIGAIVFITVRYSNGIKAGEVTYQYSC